MKRISCAERNNIVIGAMKALEINGMLSLSVGSIQLVSPMAPQRLITAIGLTYVIVVGVVT